MTTAKKFKPLCLSRELKLWLEIASKLPPLKNREPVKPRTQNSRIWNNGINCTSTNDCSKHVCEEDMFVTLSAHQIINSDR